ncbi:MAG TPA: alanine--tRNA ligase [Gemmatimonadales bacterium]|jgi:alanyl-tRNA synthetase|nr:alanine--tRNA ligase [Gemmatimonadales bacterium]
MESHQIRSLFLRYFAARGHEQVPSSSLVPADDPTLLFTNAGMVQFKRVFLGQEQRPWKRATTCQKCVRAGGKHNDLEQVGLTRRHHTFFEMLGNFSFGDYFKREAIAFAWEWVTGSDWLGLSPDRLRITVHHSDTEARALWEEISGLPPDRIHGLGDADNFWQMGDTGPCGPCSEIYVDLEWTPGSVPAPMPQEEFERQAEAGRFLEIWNLVFMQFDRATDGTLTPLPRPSVDTGAGLERIAAVMQGTDDNFHTDLFQPLLDRAGELIGRPYREDGDDRASYRVLADHARAVAFLLADGVYPSNEGRGYVLRRILRRAVRHAWLLGRREPTLTPLTQVVVQQMGDVYPELRAKADFIADVTRNEEERFLETIEGGLARLDELLATGARTIAGEDAFRLYDTFGFPIDLTQLLARERGVEVDVAGFEEALEEQRERSRSDRAGRKGGSMSAMFSGGDFRVHSPAAQTFVGYAATSSDTDVIASRDVGGRTELVLRDNPYYVESGGQVSDTGVVTADEWRLDVDRVYKSEQGTVVSGRATGPFEGTRVHAQVDEGRRRDIERNHSATHLAHYVLRRQLGTHVRQQGSLVEPNRLRFDFSHHGPIDPQHLREIEAEVNELILANADVRTDQMAYPDALALGAMAFFADKYGDQVRVVRMGPSIELCGGTHVRTTGQIGIFRFAGQGGVAAGVRRIEAMTGTAALRAVRALEDQMHRAAETVRVQPDHLLRRIEQLVEERSRLEQRIAEALAQGGGASENETVQLDGVKLTLASTASESRDEVGRIADNFRETHKDGVLVLFGTSGRGAVHVALTDDLVAQGFKAGDLVNRIAALSGGKGGGRPQFASAGAGDPERLGDVRAAVPQLVSSWLARTG